MANSIKDIIKNFKKLPFEDTQHLDDQGYLVLKNISFLKKNVDTISKISEKLISEEGDKGGWEGKEKYFKPGKKFEEGADRLGGLINKHNLFLKVINIPELILAAHHVIKDEIKVCGFNLRSPKKGYGQQGIHMDGFARKDINEPFSGVVIFIYLDDSYVENGALRVIPATHKKLGWPDDYIDIHEKHPDEVRVEVNKGDVVIANLNLWHAGAININGKQRKSIMLNIKNRSYGQLLNYKTYLNKDFIDTLTDEEKYLLAVRKNDIDHKVLNDGSANEARRRYLKVKGINTSIIKS